MVADTRFLLETALPELAQSGPDTAAEAFQRYRQQVEEAAGKPGEPESRFDWREAYSVIDDNAARLGFPERSRVAVAASHTALMYLGIEVELHDPQGTFLAVDATGRAIAGIDWPNPKVSPDYGHPDYYALLKLGGAIAVERLARQGADWGGGYTAWARLLGKPAPTIGMATLHSLPHGTVPPGTDRQALGYAGSTHRVIAPEFDDIADSDPRFTVLPRPERPSDFLAGMLDSMSSMVALRSLFGRNLFPWIVQLPDPSTDPDYVGVNLN